MNTEITRTVLVVDDAMTIRKYHRTLLEELGCEVVEAENGIDALEKLLEHQLSLCLVDVNMPLMDGFTFVTELRKGAEQADCPVIMISTESQQGELSRGYQCGVNLYLVKPAPAESLKLYCQQLMEGSVQ
ncbi:response regulator [Catenovulum sediminis]|uniref:response regulator n=1 Tax=Catenovulum sediminis TaxID=1740262 RepID=UPI00117CEF77|nr:response regulator [Catenovulum sediminis]